MKIPLVDLQAQYKAIGKEVMPGLAAVLEKCNFILGEEVQRFETAFAAWCGSAHGVGVASGTDALELALKAAGVGPGDEVIVPAHTFVATILAVTFSGARPVVIDIDESSFLMDARKAIEAITPRTRAIIPVHLYGRMMNLAPLVEAIRGRDIVIIEDAAQAHGARYAGERAGTVGTMGCFSFFPGENLGAYGDAGMVTTDDPALKAKLEALRAYGAPKKYHHPMIGYNSRLDTLQAAVLLAKLPHLEAWNEARRAVARKYNALLAGVGDLTLPELPPADEHVFHLYVVRTCARDKLLACLHDAGIAAGIHYPTPVHLHGAYADRLRQRRFSGGRACLRRNPLASSLSRASDEQLEYVVKQVKGFF